MKLLLLSSIFLLFIPIVFAACEDYTLEAIYIEKKISCDNLESIRITDPSCVPLPGDCWDNITSATLQLAGGLNSETSLIQSLDSQTRSYDWFGTKCIDPKDYTVTVNFADVCEKSITLNLAEPEPTTSERRNSRGGSSISTLSNQITPEITQDSTNEIEILEETSPEFISEDSNVKPEFVEEEIKAVSNSSNIEFLFFPIIFIVIIVVVALAIIAFLLRK